jgi:DNA-directed RNA polymerase subunit M/transcription elongation factor TFIIS
MPNNVCFDQTSNAPLDLRVKPSQHVEEPTHHHDSEEDDGRESSDDASSSSPQNAYGQKMFVCSICEQRFLSIETINEHFLKNHLSELENEIAGKSPPRNTNVAQQNEEWNLSDPNNPLKCIKCDFVGRWPTELQKHAASHSTSRPFKCLVCSLTYKWRWG